MAYKEFIPQIWSTSIIKTLPTACVFLEDCYRSFEGDVKEKGDSVRIPGIGRPTITTIARSAASNAISAAEEVADTSITMYINQVSYFNFKVADIDAAQANGDIMSVLRDEVKLGLAETVDAHIAALAADANIANSAAKQVISGATGGGSTNVLEVLNGMQTALYKNDVPSNEEIIVTVDPDFYDRFLTAYTALSTANNAFIEKGGAIRYRNMTVKMSNSIPVNGSSQSLIMARTKKSIAAVLGKAHTEAYRPELGFSDALKGFLLYQAQVVRPKEAYVVPCTYA
jgi:hypothetical protein